MFGERPALHRFPKAMAARTQELAKLIVTDYGGDPTAIWTTASSGAELLKRVEALPGFGAQKAKIFVALLGKQLGVRPPGWREAAGQFGAGVAPVGGGHLRRRVARRGALVQGGAEGRKEIATKPTGWPRTNSGALSRRSAHAVCAVVTGRVLRR